MKSIKILIAIPAYNEEKVIAGAIKDVRNKGYEYILVVNDGSSDGTKQKAEEAKAMVVSHFKNCGLGVGIRTALKYAQKNKFDILVTFDADGQHKAQDIARVIDPIIKNETDVVVGTRDLNNKYIPKARRIILFLSNLYTWILFGILSHDSQSGFRAFSRLSIERIRLHSERMEVSSEIFAEIVRHRLKYREVPIAVVYTPYSLSKGQKNSNMFRVGFKLFLKLFK